MSNILWYVWFCVLIRDWCNFFVSDKSSRYIMGGGDFIPSSVSFLDKVFFEIVLTIESGEVCNQLVYVFVGVFLFLSIFPGGWCLEDMVVLITGMGVSSFLGSSRRYCCWLVYCCLMF
jgi:hypothetical protein